MMRAAVVISAILLTAVPAAAGDTGRLLETLSSANPVIRVQAVEELATHREPRVFVALLLALRDRDADVRAHAAEALRVRGDRRAVPFLHRTLTDVDATVRCRVILSLGELGDRYLVPSLTRALADPVVIVRAAAIRALGEIGDPLSLRDVLHALRDEEQDTHGSVSGAGLIACARLAGARGLDRALGIVGDRVAGRWFLRAVYARAVGVAGADRRVSDLVAFLARDPDRRVVQAAAASLGLLGRVEPLEEATVSEDGFRRRAAVAALATMESEEVGPILVRMVGDGDPAVVLEAADGLTGRGNAAAIPVLIRLLDVSDPP
ncbi:MAG: HEAT repeat domain-containing protein, partial [Planctomycetota bacterium]